MSAVFTPMRHKLSVQDFQRLGEAGILSEDSRVELIEGELIDMAPIGALHMLVVNRLNRLLVLAVGELGVVSVQNPVRLPLYSEPQPDFAILKHRADETTVPGPEDVLLIIEVADTTLDFDRTTKLNLYAKSGISESWIVNLQSKCLEVYREPAADDGYSKRFEFHRPDSVAPLAVPTVRVAVADIFG